MSAVGDHVSDVVHVFLYIDCKVVVPCSRPFVLGERSPFLGGELEGWYISCIIHRHCVCWAIIIWQ